MNNSETTAGEAAELFRRTMVSITDQAQAEGARRRGHGSTLPAVPRRRRRRRLTPARAVPRWCGRGDSNPYVLSDTRT
jgi:hypothetical protein